MPGVAVVGAGVIGQIYAALLARSGVPTVLLARGGRAEELRREGVRLASPDPDFAFNLPVKIVAAATPPPADVAIIAVRAQDVASAAEAAARTGATTVISFMHLAGHQSALAERIPPAHLVTAFPGVGGERRSDGVITWIPIRQQPTTVDARARRTAVAAAALRRTGLPVVTERRMPDWLATHEIFVAGLGAGVLRAGGDPAALAADPALLRDTMTALRSGFRGYRRAGGRPRPRSLALLLGTLPPVVARRYWRSALQGDLGRLAIAPHCRASAADEFPLVCAAAARRAPTASAFAAWVRPYVARVGASGPTP